MPRRKGDWICSNKKDKSRRCGRTNREWIKWCRECGKHRIKDMYDVTQTDRFYA